MAATEGYAISQQKRKLIEQAFGWAKLIGPIRQVMVRGLAKVDQLFVLTMAAYKLRACGAWGKSVCRGRKRCKSMEKDPKTAKNQTSIESA